MSDEFNMRTVGGKFNYRSDIDGLRAIACISVVLFHAFPSILRGGFVGVDIFFVISGFLISSILYRHLFDANQPGKIHIIDFYIRRVRRIFPALIAVLVTTLALGWFVLLPDEYRLLGKHTIGGATYINNLMLYKESGDYFNPSSNVKPLLHLWSLGIEEQFYLVFPLILWLIYKSKLNFVLALTIFTLLSFFVNKNAVSHNHQTVAFYMPWCRFWELSAGAILAYIIDYNKDALLRIKEKLSTYLPNIIFREKKQAINEIFINNAISVIGLLTIIVGILSIKNDLSFPGKKALIPVIGSLLIIGAGSGAIINRHLLSSKIMVFLGLISYPLYLWHWPFLSLAYICEGRTPDVWIRCSAIAIAFILAVITYIFIEPPLRYGTYSKTKAITLFIAMLFVGFIGYRVMDTDGFKNRFSQLMKTEEQFIIDEKTKKYHIKFYNVYDEYVDNCKIELANWADTTPPSTCAMQRKPGKNNIAIIGSSHAGHLFYGLTKVVNKNIYSIAVFSVPSQSPFINLQRTIDEEKKLLYPRITYAYKFIEEHKNIKTVILADLASNYFLDIENPLEKDFQKILENALIRSLERLKSRNVIIVLDNPKLPIDPSKCSSKRPYSITEFDTSCTFNEADSPNSNSRKIHYTIIRNVTKNYPNVRIVDLWSLFCKNNTCSPIQNGEMLYIDDNHFNYKGSKYVAPYIYQHIRGFVHKCG